MLRVIHGDQTEVLVTKRARLGSVVRDSTSDVSSEVGRCCSPLNGCVPRKLQRGHMAPASAPKILAWVVLPMQADGPPGGVFHHHSLPLNQTHKLGVLAGQSCTLKGCMFPHVALLLFHHQFACASAWIKAQRRVASSLVKSRGITTCAR